MNTHSNHSVQLLTRTIILNTKGSRIIMYHRTDTSVHLFGIKTGWKTEFITTSRQLQTTIMFV